MSHMEFNSGVSMFLPDTIGIDGNDFDEEDREDIVHEQTNQNEIVELIMAAFEGHEEPSDGEEEDEDDDDDDENESLNTSHSSHHLPTEHAGLNTNNNNNNNTEHFHSQQQTSHDLFHRNHLFQQPLFSTPAVSTPPPLVPPSSSTDVRRFDDYTHSRYDEQDLGYSSKSSALVRYQNTHRTSSNTVSSGNVQYFDTLPTIDPIDPLQNQFLYQNSSDTQNQLNKYRILCNVKDRKITELENRCTEYHEKYNQDLRVLKHKIELAERAKYDSEQRYQSITGQCEELIQTNNQLQRTIKDSELRIQQLETNKLQLEKKLDEAESLIDSLHRKVNELQRFESVARTQQDCEMILSSTREKHEQELITVNEKLQITQMNLQEKTTEVDELRVQLDSACRTNEKAIFERMETINHLNQQLLECQKQYSDLLTSKSSDTIQQLTRITEEKERLEETCEELQSEIRTLRERLGATEHELNKDLFGISHISVNETSKQIVPHNSTSFDNPNESLIDENQHLKERIDEYAANERNLIEVNEDLQRQIQDLSDKINQPSETAIANSIHIEQIQSLTNEIEQRKLDYDNLFEKYEYEKQELKTIIEQLREDIVDLDKTKQLYIDVCQEKNSIEDKLRAKFEYEIKMKLDDLRRNHEKIVNELNNELNYLKANDDAKSRTIEQLHQEKLRLNQIIDEYKRNNGEINIEVLQKINNYENTISQYEGFRLKLEGNLQKISQQRDTYKNDLRLTKEILKNKEKEYREKILSIENDRMQLETRLDEAHRALNLADSHLKQEVEKIKMNLEQEYNRRYEHKLKQLRQQLIVDSEQQNRLTPSRQDREETKK